LIGARSFAETGAPAGARLILALSGSHPNNERVLKVLAGTAPGLVAGRPVPKPQP
jgi:hypothetical protein